MPKKRNPDLLRTVGRRVAQARGDRGWTQEQLAEAIGIEPVSLSRLETGDRALSLTTLGLVADALGLGLGQLVGVEADLPKPDLTPQEAELLRGFASLSAARRDLVLRLVRELAE
jgi:transcriptional regulator with XRE-family HTH domain